MSQQNQITTLTFFRYNGLSTKFWAFGMMQYAHKDLNDVRGLEFYKLMGTGNKSGFNPFPDWSTYCLLQVWKSESEAKDFLAKSELMERYNNKASEKITYFLKNIAAHGQWSQKEPFVKSTSLSTEDLPIAVITRATIKTKHLIKFWNYVPTAEKPIEKAAGLKFKKGIGEMPIKQMATFSIWDNAEAIKKYAYESKAHKKAIEMTRTYNWYSEELFSRFQLYHTEGTWENA
jgi:hypothetical protein